ncbi:hypothetical protein D7D52_19460 [Nocardia yunnanensis]|uniref:Uncharacterized protein n=2 Tax=Nocardia yunnanensis TaxID=2382165 RepID=A0A386ZDR0_9NOCA|nr:hypothetical protein D7D52_19460 [Nocardia yunnanensis]
MAEYAIGFLRREISGPQKPQHEMEMHAVAERYGYTICLMVLVAPEREAVVQRLMTLVWNEGANAIIAPSADHFEPGEIDALVKLTDVIYVDTGDRLTIHTDDMSEADGHVFP